MARGILCVISFLFVIITRQLIKYHNVLNKIRKRYLLSAFLKRNYYVIILEKVVNIIKLQLYFYQIFEKFKLQLVKELTGNNF